MKILSLMLTFAVSFPIVAQPRKEVVERQTKMFFERNDKNKDGKLSREEFPERARVLFRRIDTNNDGFVTMKEDIAFRSRGRGAPRLPAGYEAHRDIEYAKVGDKSLKLDVYAPQKSDKPLPLIVWIHGGAWRAGDKKQCPALRFTRAGFVVASVNYRLSQEAIYPAQIHDCKGAIRWLRANAKKYHIDPDKVAVWGSSAGGHLVALLGTSGDVREMEGDVGGNLTFSSRVQLVCDFFGPTDFLQMDAHALPGARLKHDPATSPESLLVGGAIQKNKDKVKKANPITYVSKDDPPFLILHGDKDPLVPHHQSEILTEALKKAGVKVTFKTVKGAGHGLGGRKEVDEEVNAFFATLKEK